MFFLAFFPWKLKARDGGDETRSSPIETLESREATFAAVVHAETHLADQGETREAEEGAEDDDAEEEQYQEVLDALGRRRGVVDAEWVARVMGHLAALSANRTFAIILRSVLSRSRIRAAGAQCMAVRSCLLPATTTLHVPHRRHHTTSIYQQPHLPSNFYPLAIVYTSSSANATYNLLMSPHPPIPPPPSPHPPRLVSPPSPNLVHLPPPPIRRITSSCDYFDSPGIVAAAYVSPTAFALRSPRHLL